MVSSHAGEVTRVLPGCLALVRAAAAGQQLSLLGSMPGMAWHGMAWHWGAMLSGAAAAAVASTACRDPGWLAAGEQGFSGQRAVCAELCVCVGLDIQSCAVGWHREELQCVAVCGRHC